MSDRSCSTTGCGSAVAYTTKGFCKRCYNRERAIRTGKTRPSTPNIARFEAKIAPGENGCWQWTGSRTGSGSSYAAIHLQGRRTVYAHRWSYEYHRADIPAGLEVDHLCHNTLCVNPWHLEPVTRKVNAERTRPAMKTQCVNGHEYTPENTSINVRGERGCKTCMRARSAAARARRRALTAA